MQITQIQITLLFFYALAMSVGIYISIIFFSKIKRTRRSGFDVSVFIGLGAFFFLVGISYLFWFYYYFNLYQFEENYFSLFYVAYFLSYGAIIALMSFSEKMLGKTKFIITLFGLFSISYGLIFLSSIEDLQNFAWITMSIFAPITLLLLLLSIVIKTKGETRRKMVYAIICGLFFYGFYLLDTVAGRALLPIPGELTAIIAMIGIIITGIIWGSIFASFETFTELGWREKLKELFIIAPNGATLFYFSFEKQTDNLEVDLITAGLTGIKGLLAEVMRSDKALKVVDHQDVKIIFEYGKYSTLALIIYENLRIYHAKLAQLSNQFERLFHDVLIHWNGEIEVFRLSKNLIEDIFS